MSTSPTWPEELPRCLEPWNWRHYFLLLYWILLKPTALKYYYLGADPRLYRGWGEGLSIADLLENTALRSLLLISIRQQIALLALSAFVRFAFLLIVAFARHSQVFPISIQDLSIVKEVVSRMFLDANSDETNCAIIYFFALLICSVVFAQKRSHESPAPPPPPKLQDKRGAMLLLPEFFLNGIDFLSLSLLLLMLYIITVLSVYYLFTPTSSLMNGVLVGGLFSLLTSHFKYGSFMAVPFGPVAAFTYEWRGCLIKVLVFYFAFLVSLVRLPSYLFEIIIQPKSCLGLSHPIWWDEVNILPFWGFGDSVDQAWLKGEVFALTKFVKLAANPFQYWALQRILVSHLHSCSSPISFIYLILRHKDLDALAIVEAPLITLNGVSERFSVRNLFLSELAGMKPDYIIGSGLIRSLTQSLRIACASPLTALVRILFEISLIGVKASVAAVEWDHLIKVLSIDLFQPLLAYPGGGELQSSFTCITKSLQATTLSDLTQTPILLSDLPPTQDAIRPEVIEALHRLGSISQNIAVAEAASSRLNRLAAFARATEALEELGPFIEETVVVPEKVLLLRIREHWRSLVAEAGGRLGQQVQFQRVVNPYVAGNPVKGCLFVGRDELLCQLEELWLKPGPVDSVVLYGHRRMGKSSILQNLAMRIDPASNWVVDFNLQTVNRSHTGSLLFDLASKMRDTVLLNSSVAGFAATASVELTVPEEQAFRANYQRAFNQWLDRLSAWVAGRRMIIAIDEYELLEEGMSDARLDAELTIFLRGVIQTRDWFVLALAGLYTVHEQCHDYWHPFFNSIKERKVSFLSPTASRRLLSQPCDDFPLDYTSETLDRIYALSHGQPYLVQLIGQNLVYHYNSKVLDGVREPSQPLSLADLEAVIVSPNFYEDGFPYFNGVWLQAQDSPPGQQAILYALSSTAADQARLTELTGLSVKETSAALDTLKARDIIHQDDVGDYHYTVELMRRWVASHATLRGIEPEINHD